MKVYSITPGAVRVRFVQEVMKWEYYYTQHDQYGKANICPYELFPTAKAAAAAMNIRVDVLREQLIRRRMLG